MSFARKALAAAGLVGFAAWRRSRRPDPLDLAGASVVITGGSRGLGLELARAFAAEGARLTLLARDEDELDDAWTEFRHEREDVLVHACDVRERAEVRDAVQYVLQKRGRIDVLVNCAGVIQTGPVEHMEEDDFEGAMDVHFRGPLYTMLEVIPAMKRQGGGRIANVSSVGGLVAVPHLMPYSASKFALTGLSDGMRAELARHDIRVTTVWPGLMRTGSHRQAWFKGQHRREFDWFAIADASPLLSTSAEKAARQIVEACRTGKRRLVITPQARLLRFAEAVVPEFVAAAMEEVARLLPRPTGPGGDEARRGWASRNRERPSLLTLPADDAARRNNEMHDHAATKDPGQSDLV